MSKNKTTPEFEGIYEVPEAARYIHADIRLPSKYAKVKSADLIRWIRMGLADPNLKKTPGRQILITFEDLVSMRVIAFLRALGYSFTDIRRVEARLRNMTKHGRPFAIEQVWAEKKGAVDIFAEVKYMLMAVTRGTQLPFIELVKDHLIDVHGLTFNEQKVAESWYPRPGIELHPRIQFGRPCVSGTRIPTADLVGMIRAGDTMAFLAKSYGLAEHRIQKAVAWEGELAALAAA